MDEQAVARQATKIIEHHFVRTLIDEFQFAPRIAQAVLAEAQASLSPAGTVVAFEFIHLDSAGSLQALDGREVAIYSPGQRGPLQSLL